MLLAVLSYFFLVTAVLALLFLPDVRARALRGAQRAFDAGRVAASSVLSVGQLRAARAGAMVGQHASNTLQGVRRRGRRLAIALAVLAGALGIPLALRGWQELEGFDHTASHEMNEQVTALLQGEQLVPPAPVPPELFTTREVEAARPMIRLASRQWELLDDDFRQRLLVVFKIMQETHGYQMVLLEGYRSPERQAKLAALGSSVTQAGAFESYHQFGLAADCAFMRDGRIVITETDPWAARGYDAYGAVARSVGLTWGGGWRTIKDLGHVELSRPGVLRKGGAAAAPPASHAP